MTVRVTDAFVFLKVTCGKFVGINKERQTDERAGFLDPEVNLLF